MAYPSRTRSARSTPSRADCRAESRRSIAGRARAATSSGRSSSGKSTAASKRARASTRSERHASRARPRAPSSWSRACRRWASVSASMRSATPSALQSALEGVERAERVRDGYAIALTGAPNAGKSTLLNALSRREAAIVTATPGTTRDVIEVTLQLAGYKVILADTAGLRDTPDEVEAEGVRRARRRAEAADLRLWVVDGAGDEASPAPDVLRSGDLCLVAKADLPVGDAAARALAEAASLGLDPHRLSAHRSEDIAALEAVLSRHVIAALGSAEPPSATRLRHAALLAEAVQRLESALALSAEPELAAEDVRLAARALDRITGKIGPEDVLDRIFSTFCIGK
jgi:tRNA modification GTPase